MHGDGFPRFAALACPAPQASSTRLTVFRAGEDGISHGSALLDVSLDGDDQADDVLAQNGWIRTSRWWRYQSGAVARVVPRGRRVEPATGGAEAPSAPSGAWPLER